MDDIKIIPGILEKDLDEIKRKLSLVENIFDLVQLDIQDGKFCPNSTYANVEELEKLEPNCNLEWHIQTANPQLYLPKRIGKISKIIVHVESDTFDRQLLEDIKHMGVELGVAINPETDVFDVEPFFEFIDCIQFMTIHPGIQGQELIPEVLQKIKDFKELKTGIPIEIDGGVNDKTIKKIVNSGAEMLEVGKFIFLDDDIEGNLEKLEMALHEN